MRKIVKIIILYRHSYSIVFHIVFIVPLSVSVLGVSLVLQWYRFLPLVGSPHFLL